MSSNDDIIVELSKYKIVRLFFFSVVFVALGVWMLSLDDEFIRSQQRFNSPIFIHGLGIMSIVFAGLGGIYIFRKFFDKSPGLIFSSDGIVDNASGVSAGFVPWVEVTGSTIFEMNKHKMLVIMVSNPQKYVARGNILKQALNKANQRMCGSPIIISENVLKLGFPELIATFESYHQKYGNSKSD